MAQRFLAESIITMLCGVSSVEVGERFCDFWTNMMCCAFVRREKLLLTSSYLSLAISVKTDSNNEDRESVTKKTRS